MRLALDERLQTAAALFPACAYGADIGADHGRLSCFLLESDICERMCVADISGDSLKKAEKLLREKALIQRADLMVGDGLSVLPHPAQAIAILGMGGHTMAGILETGRDRLQGAALILSPQTEIPLIRQTLARLHYHLEDERIAFASGRYYVLLKAIPGHEEYSDRQLWLGPRLMSGCTRHYPDYLAWQMRITAPKRTREAARYMNWLKEEEERVRYRKND